MTRHIRPTRITFMLSAIALGAMANGSLAADSSISENRGDAKQPALNGAVNRVQNAAELARMQQYLAQRLDKNSIRQSLVNSKGRKIECVDINAQPAFRNPALAGHKLELAPRSAPPQNLAPVVANAAQVEPLREIKNGIISESIVPGCPAGSVPIPEVTMEDLQRFPTLEAFFAKAPNSLARPQPLAIPPTHNGPTSQHQYAHAYRFVTNWGAQANINIWPSATELNNEFSLGQIWVVGGSGTGLQTLEAGTQKYHDLYNDNNPHLFIYSTRGGYAPGTGCYNNTCGDFVQVSSSFFPAMGLSPVSTFGGTQYEANFNWFKDMDGGAWWLSYQGQWVGYYPRALYNAAGVQNHAAEIDFGGEIIDNRNGNLHTSTDMGSGSFPSAWYQKAAYMRLLKYNSSTSTNPNTVWNSEATGLTPSRSDAACYDIAYYSGDANWGSYFFYGGPGFDATNCR